MDLGKENEYNDYILIDLLKNDKDRSISLIYQRYWKELYIYVHLLSQNKNLTEDIIQETFFNIWKYKNSIEVNETIIGYLKKTAKNTFYKYQKKMGLLPITKQVDTFQEFLTIKDQDNIVENIEYAEIQYKIRNLVQKMPSQMKNVFLLRQDYELSYRDISKKMNIAEGTVKKQLFYALKLLKKNISK